MAVGHEGNTATPGFDVFVDGLRRNGSFADSLGSHIAV